jgi:hypothetical protein
MHRYFCGIEKMEGGGVGYIKERRTRIRCDGRWKTTTENVDAN